MPTCDFFDDAVDSLKKDDHGEYLLFYAQPGSQVCSYSVHVSSEECLQWFEKKMGKVIKGFRDLNEGQDG